MSTASIDSTPRSAAIAPGARVGSSAGRVTWGTRIWHGLAIFAIIIAVWLVFSALIRPWYMHWGATEAETAQTLPGDELIASADSGKVSTLGITVNASASSIWPWLVQFGQAKGGWYSYEWFENLIGCQMTNADRIVPEWQQTQVGDYVRMYPEGSGPPAYRVAQLIPNRALVIGHPKGDLNAPITSQTQWADSWALILQPSSDNTTRLLFRSRWDPTDPVSNSPMMSMLDPGFFVMERGMLMGIRDRVEKAAGTYTGGSDSEGPWFAFLVVAALGIVALLFAKRWPYKPVAIAVATALWFVAFFPGHPMPLVSGLVALVTLLMAAWAFWPDRLAALVRIRRSTGR